MQIKTYIIILELLVRDDISSRNFLLLNKVFSIESKTLIIFPPVLFNIDKLDVKYTASSSFILSANLLNATSISKPKFISELIFLNSFDID